MPCLRKWGAEVQLEGPRERRRDAMHGYWADMLLVLKTLWLITDARTLSPQGERVMST